MRQHWVQRPWRMPERYVRVRDALRRGARATRRSAEHRARTGVRACPVAPAAVPRALSAATALCEGHTASRSSRLPRPRRRRRRHRRRRRSSGSAPARASGHRHVQGAVCARAAAPASTRRACATQASRDSRARSAHAGPTLVALTEDAASAASVAVTCRGSRRCVSSRGVRMIAAARGTAAQRQGSAFAALATVVKIVHARCTRVRRQFLPRHLLPCDGAKPSV